MLGVASLDVGSRAGPGLLAFEGRPTDPLTPFAAAVPTAIQPSKARRHALPPRSDNLDAADPVLQ